jgi:acetoin utilization protein AcuB
MVMTEQTIGTYMTPCPITIGVEQPLRRAHELMRQHDVRHLPVLRAGQVVGMLSMRDLHFIETLRDVDPDVVRVEEAMTAEPYAVGKGTRLAKVAASMAARRLGSAVIVEKGKVVGVFTTTDALRVLAALSQ